MWSFWELTTILPSGNYMMDYTLREKVSSRRFWINKIHPSWDEGFWRWARATFGNIPGILLIMQNLQLLLSKVISSFNRVCVPIPMKSDPSPSITWQDWTVLTRLKHLIRGSAALPWRRIKQIPFHIGWGFEVCVFRRHAILIAADISQEPERSSRWLNHLAKIMADHTTEYL